MAAFASSAPLPGRSALVEEEQFQEIVRRSRRLIQKILLSVPDTHAACIRTEGLQLNSTENAKLATMASIIGMPPAPVVRAVSGNVTLEESLRRMYEGLQLHRALLSSISPRLDDKVQVIELMADVRDLGFHINKILKMVQTEGPAQSTQPPVVLHLPGDYEVQVAAHLILVQLQSFSQDVARFLRSLDHSNEDDTES